MYKNYNEVKDLIENFNNLFNNIKFEYCNTNNNHKSNGNTYNYVDNSWNSFYTTNNYYTSSKKKDEDKDEGNHPIVFLLTAGTLAIGATYLIATDEYLIIKKKFSKLDELLDEIEDKTKNTVMEGRHKELKKYYDNFKEKLLSKHSSSYYSKLGLIGSSLVTLTYFFPFGLLALYPGIIGMTGFSCYWLWNFLTNNDLMDLINERNKILLHINNYNSDLNFLFSTFDTNNWTQCTINPEYQSQSVYPSYNLNESAPTYNIDA